PFFKNKVTAVVGSANAAFETAKYLSTICKKVYMFVRSAQLGADPVLSDEVKQSANVEIILNASVKEIKGGKKVESVILSVGSEEKEVALDGLFIDVGYALDTAFIKDFVKTDERGFIVIDNENKTSVDGVFGAGDVTTVPFKQTVIAAGEGAKAALSAVRWIKTLK
ncbi:MAG: FAD-dependent oxidoreductase, partial [Parcubacteria group bacterium]